jgi:oligosaccharide repeat unit polymerase
MHLGSVSIYSFVAEAGRGGQDRARSFQEVDDEEPGQEQALVCGLVRKLEELRTRTQNGHSRLVLNSLVALVTVVLGTIIVRGPGLHVGAFIETTALFLAFVIVLSIAKDILLKEFEPFNVKYFVLLGFLCFGSVAMFYNVYLGGFSKYHHQVVQKAALAIYVGLIAFLAGYNLTFRRHTLRLPLPEHPLKTSSALRLSLLFFFIAALILGCCSYSVYKNPVGFLLRGYSAERQRFHEALGVSYVFSFVVVFTPAALLAFYVMLTTRRTLAKYVAVLIIFSAGLFYFLKGVRWHFMSFCMALVGFYYWTCVRSVSDKRLKRLKALKCVLFLTGAALTAVVIGTVRGATIWKAENSSPVSATVSVFHGGTFDNFSNLLTVMDGFPQKHDFLPGYSVFSVLANPVPRALWPGKPVAFGQVMSTSLRHGVAHHNVSATIFGEAYGNMGMIGVFLGLFLLGALAKLCYKTVSLHRGSLPVVMLYTMTLFVFFMEVRGDFLCMTVPFLIQFLPTYLCLCFVSSCRGSSLKMRV